LFSMVASVIACHTRAKRSSPTMKGQKSWVTISEKVESLPANFRSRLTKKTWNSFRRFVKKPSRGILHICQKHFCDEGEHSDRHPALQFDDQFSTGIQFRGQYYDFGLYILPEPCEFTTQHVTQCGFIQISLNLLKQCMYIVCHAQNHGCNK
jgi:hypothetical protein